MSSSGTIVLLLCQNKNTGCSGRLLKHFGVKFDPLKGATIYKATQLKSVMGDILLYISEQSHKVFFIYVLVASHASSCKCIYLHFRLVISGVGCSIIKD